jgi:hypothetical protein
MSAIQSTEVRSRIAIFAGVPTDALELELALSTLCGPS